MSLKSSANLLGVYGGTFDPIHNGHIQPVVEAAEQLGISKVLLLPCHIPPHKEQPSTPAGLRLKMVELVCDHYPQFIADDRELNKTSPSYTVETLRTLREEYPHSTLCFFMGGDSFANLNTWFKWEAILDYCHIVVCQRDTQDTQLSPVIEEYLAQFECENAHELREKKQGNIYLAKTNELAISSTEIRNNLWRDASWKTCLPIYIYEFIRAHNLYPGQEN